MPAKGSAISRVLNFFREADPDVARVTFQLVQEVMRDRTPVTNKPAPKPRQTRHKKDKLQDTLEQSQQHKPTAAAAPAGHETPQVWEIV